MSKESERIRNESDRSERLDWQHTRAGAIPYFEVYFPDVTIDLVNIRSDKTTWVIGSTYILGHDPGAVGFDRGALGSNRLGSVKDTVTRVAESRMYQELIEDYDTTTFKDSVLTSAFWETTGSVRFGAGSELFDTTGDFGSGIATSGIGSEGGSLALL